ncbi:GNAT family N-acetyltransferase [Magnetospirillum molischianum]|uniref:Putative acetyltransferase n=1 Tax=Magnetospirillum molischianum DSM 120 TaxID=1150626 RepID=H8FW42_MAGML|nr:GNAT family N-acetyltransferase [Magnetospirillum molischianum]CCG42580.1 putative acetyltransferase [Magnetospirillum molischianum DSM 120]
MEIRIVRSDKKRFLDLLLLGDEQESMIDRYLDRGTLFVLDDFGTKSICVVTDEGEGIFEVKNLATAPDSQRRGYGGALLEHVVAHHTARGRWMLVGTGDSPQTVPFYRHHGFEPSHRVANFFLDHYDHPIFENGVQLVDMIYLKRSLAYV